MSVLLAFAAVSIVSAIGAIAWGLRTNDLTLSRVGHAAFALEVLSLFIKTVGSLIGLWLFFVVTGAGVIGLAVLRGDVSENYRDRISSANAVPVDYGIESYFVPEGEGKRLEKLIGKGEMRVIAAVASDGRVGIKGIEAQGKRVHEEKVW